MEESMHIKISGQHLNLGESLQNYVEERLQKTLPKFFDQVLSAEVHFNKNAHLYHCTIIVNEKTGHHLLIKGTGEEFDDAYMAFDYALSKITKQLRKYKDKIKNHHKKSISDLNVSDIQKLKGTKYTISPSEENIDNPVIIAEKTTPIQTLTVAEAVMLMDLADLPAMVFVNKLNERINFIYYRKDGNISWVDPEVL